MTYIRMQIVQFGASVTSPSASAWPRHSFLALGREAVGRIASYAISGIRSLEISVAMTNANVESEHTESQRPRLVGRAGASVRRLSVTRPLCSGDLRRILTAMEALDASAKRNAELVAQVGPERWDIPAPCTEWRVRTLVGHLIAGRQVYCELLKGIPAATLWRMPGSELLVQLIGDCVVHSWDLATALGVDPGPG